jgi:hypothetical protein
MKSRNYIFILLFLIGASLFSSCRDESTTVGSKWLESSFKNYETDTCTVTLSTVLSDSLATSGDSICQIGHYKDSQRGAIGAAFYTEYNVTSTKITFEKNNQYRYDSIQVRMYPSGDYLGDSLSGPQEIAIHRLQENIEMDDNGYLYNRTNAKYDPTPLTTFTYKPHPGRKTKEITCRLPDEFGLDWFNRMLDGQKRLQEQVYFRDYFKGFVFKPTSKLTNDNVSGFQVNDSSFTVILYYHDVTSTPTAKRAIFTPNTTRTFNKIDFDRTGTPLANLVPGINNALSTDKTSHTAHIQGLTGMYVMIDFPTLNDFNAEGEMVSIEKAYLQLFPVKYSYNDANPLPPKLQLYSTDTNGVTQDVIYNVAGTSVQTGSLVQDDITQLNTYYTFDITTYLQGILGTGGTNRKRLKLILPNSQFFSTCQGVLLADKDYYSDRHNIVKLTLLYKTYNEQK